jgi:hypothetical protein
VVCQSFLVLHQARVAVLPIVQQRARTIIEQLAVPENEQLATKDPLRSLARGQEAIQEIRWSEMEKNMFLVQKRQFEKAFGGVA